jgi:hypothetical protein
VAWAAGANASIAVRAAAPSKPRGLNRFIL